MDRLESLMQRQAAYNSAVRWRNGKPNEDLYWMKEYVLGMMSELDELLDETPWKRHRRKQMPLIQRNVEYELADLFKYLLSLADVLGVGIEDLLGAVEEKSIVLEKQLEQEWQTPPTEKRILVTDLDGTIADWRSSFVQWLQREKGIAPTHYTPDIDNMLMDVALHMQFPEYEKYKEEFEQSGGYAHLIPYMDGVQTVQQMQKEGVLVYVFTARPANRLRQIWYDTWLWLHESDISPDRLDIGQEPRILSAWELQRYNQVILFEDDPTLALRAAQTGLRVFVRSQPYNQWESLREHPKVLFVDTFDQISVQEYWWGMS